VKTDTTRGKDILIYKKKRYFQSTRGKDIFNLLDKYFKENDLEWEKLAGCTTDGAPSLLGQKSGFQAYVKTAPPNATFIHCFIHIIALSAKTLQPEFLSCLKSSRC